jgi:psiF repeat
MRLILALTAAALLSINAYAAEPTCTAAATEKKLAGAAKNSFMKKCEAAAQAKCEAAAAERKLAGAAKNSNVKKCMSEAVGS